MKKEQVLKMPGRMSRQEGILDIIPIRKFNER